VRRAARRCDNNRSPEIRFLPIWLIRRWSPTVESIVKKFVKVWIEGLGSNLKYRVSILEIPDFGDIFKMGNFFRCKVLLHTTRFKFRLNLFEATSQTTAGEHHRCSRRNKLIF
jgi:hypothetical protein